MLATVFGDVHDIGKSLVNTILTNNGYTVVDLGKQVPIQTILDAAQEHEATAIGLSALLVSTSKQMPLAIQELHAQGLDYPVLIGGAAINREFGYARCTRAARSPRTVYDPGVFYCKDAFEGLAVMDQLVDPRRAPRSWRSCARRPPSSARRARCEEELDTADDSVRSAARTDVADPRRRRSGACARSRSTSTRSTRTSTRTCCSSCTGAAAASRARRGRSCSSEDFRPRLERMWAEQDYLHPRALLGYFPCYARGQRHRRARPRGPRDAMLTRFVCPRQPKGDRICLADFFRPKEPGELDVVAVQAVTVGSEVTELMAKLEAEGEFAEQLFVHGLGVQTAEGLAEWLHWRVRDDLGIDAAQGRRYSWGYPAVPEQSEHLKVEQLLGPRADRHGDHRRLRADPRAVDARAGRPPPAGDLLRHAQGRLLPDGSPRTT